MAASIADSTRSTSFIMPERSVGLSAMSGAIRSR